ncbi:FAD/NAD(P)-binding domain-containing protein [Mycena polygramma]|nr:FAD/NAD(P)-binding domain-containing protein [Mycena polygramma]
MVDPLPSSTEVCIVGAGPSGLACAVGLAARGIPFVIVDALEVGHTSSRAVLIQASALEFDTGPRSLRRSIACRIGVHWNPVQDVDNHRQLCSLRFEDIAPYTKYAFSLLIPQHEVERRLRENVQRSGHSIHWRKRVTQVKEVADGAQYELGFESGEVLTARYVVAADGSKSFMRSFAGIQFLDPYTNKEAISGENDSSFVVADVLFAKPVPANVPRDRLLVMVGAGGVLLTAPLLDTSGGAADNLYRLYLGVPGTPLRSRDAAYLQAILDARGLGSHSTLHAVPQIVKVLDASRYRTRAALADRPSTSTATPPFKLLLGKRTTSAVAAWMPTRPVVARKVVDSVVEMGKFENGVPGWGSYLRGTFLWMAFKLPFVNRMAAWNLSGLGHAKKP